MTDTNKTASGKWTIKKALALGVICLLAGVAGGWSIRGAQHSGSGSIENARNASSPNVAAASTSQTQSPLRLKDMADAQAAPLLEKLKVDSNNLELLTSVGNLYYDAQQYPVAVDYYGRVLKLKASDAAVRTDMATAYWYMGNADTAIAEFTKALTFEPNNPNTLFNRGLVRWKGKKDGPGAVADWNKLLAANPKYEGKDKVEEMLAEVKNREAKAN